MTDAPTAPDRPTESDGRRSRRGPPASASAASSSAVGSDPASAAASSSSSSQLPTADPSTNGIDRLDDEDDDPDVAVPPTSWPESAPSETEEHVASVVCGNSHLHWAFHHGVKSDVNPALFWRTPPLNDDDLTGSTSEALSRHLPQFAHDYIFGPGSQPTSESALECSAKRASPKLSVYVISTNSDQVSLLARMWRSIPCRMYLMGGDDFFSIAEGRYETMGVDRLSTLRGAAEIHGFPALVFDGGTATTYTAADSDGRILGGGIGPGLQVKFRSLSEYTDALPHVGPDEVLTMVRDAVDKKRPFPVFARDTKEAIMVDVLSELAVKGRNVIQRWLDRVGPGGKSSGKRSGGVALGSSHRSNDERAVLVTGGDGEILTQLFQPDHGGIVDLGKSYRQEGRKYAIMHAKHLIHYGISSALMRQVRARRRADDIRRGVAEAERNDGVIGQRVAKRFDDPDGDGDHVYRGEVGGIERAEGEEDEYLVTYDDGDKENVGAEQLEAMIKLYNEVGEKASGEKKGSGSGAGAGAKQRQPRGGGGTPKPAAQAKSPASAAADSSSAPSSSGRKKARGKAAKSDPDMAPAMPVPGSSPRGKKRRAPPTPEGGGTPSSAPPSSQHQAKRAKVALGELSPPEYVGSRVAKDFDGEIFFGRITRCEDPDKASPLWHVVYDDGDEEDFDRTDLKRGLRMYQKNKAGDPNPPKENGDGDRAKKGAKRGSAKKKDASPRSSTSSKDRGEV